MLFSYFLFILLCIKCFVIQGELFYASTFGAYPNDNIDDAKGIQLAVDTAIKSGLNSTVVFGYGIYNFSSTVVITNATNLTITGQGIDRTFLVGNKPISIFLAEYCERLLISLLSLGFDPLSFTAGYVVNVNSSNGY